MKPLWRQAFDAIERTVAPTLQDATASAAFADAMKVTTKLARDIARQNEAMSRQWLHLWNLPAAGDIRSLRNQIGSLENEVRSLRTALDVQTRAGASNGAAPSKRTTASRPGAKSKTPSKPAAKAARKPKLEVA